MIETQVMATYQTSVQIDHLHKQTSTMWSPCHPSTDLFVTRTSAGNMHSWRSVVEIKCVCPTDHNGY